MGSYTDNEKVPKLYNIKFYVFVALIIIAIVLGFFLVRYFRYGSIDDNLKSFATAFNEALESGEYKDAKYELNKMVIYKDLPQKYRTLWEIKINNYIEEYEEKSGLKFEFNEP